MEVALPAVMAGETLFPPLLDEVNLADIAHKLKLVQKLARLKEDILSGKHPTLKLTRDVLDSRYPQILAEPGSRSATTDQKRRTAGGEQVPTLQGLNTLASLTAAGSDIHEFETIGTPVRAPEKGDVLKPAARLGNTHPSTHAVAKGSKTEGPARIVPQAVEDQDFGVIKDVRDLPYIDVAGQLAKAQLLVPPLLATEKPSHLGAATSDSSINTKSYYSSRASWTPEKSVTVDDSPAYPGAQVSSKLVKRTARSHSQQNLLEAERLSEDDDIYNVNRPAIGNAETDKSISLVYEPYLSSRSERPDPREPLDSSDELDDDYEPPAADAFDDASDYEPTVSHPTHSKRHSFELARSKRRNSNGDNRQRLGPGLKNKQLVAHRNHIGLRSPQLRQPTLKRKRMDSNTETLSRAKRPDGDIASRARERKNGVGLYIKEEPISPTVQAAMVSLPITPPTATRRRRSGYFSDAAAREPGSIRNNSTLHPSHRQQPSLDRNQILQTANLSTTARGAQPIAEPPIPPPVVEKDALKVVAIGTYTGKAYYNRPMRPGDVIPAPDPTVPEMDDTPKTASAHERAATVVAESREALYGRPEGGLAFPSHATSAISGQADASRPRAYSVYKETGPREYHPPPLLERQSSRMLQHGPDSAVQELVRHDYLTPQRYPRLEDYYSHDASDPGPSRRSMIVEDYEYPSRRFSLGLAPNIYQPSPVPEQDYRLLSSRKSLLENALRQRHEQHAPTVPTPQAYRSTHQPYEDGVTPVSPHMPTRHEMLPPPPSLVSKLRASAMRSRASSMVPQRPFQHPFDGQHETRPHSHIVQGSRPNHAANFLQSPRAALDAYPPFDHQYALPIARATTMAPPALPPSRPVYDPHFPSHPSLSHSIVDMHQLTNHNPSEYAPPYPPPSVTQRESLPPVFLPPNDAQSGVGYPLIPHRGYPHPAYDAPRREHTAAPPYWA